MHPLLYLASRTFINGIKRSFSSPMRAIATVFFVASQMFYMLRGVGQLISAPVTYNIPIDVPVPPMDMIAAVLFGAYFIISWFWLLQMFSPPTGFQRADADVLFATPVKSKEILTFQLARNAIFRLISPLIFAVTLWRPATSLAKYVGKANIPIQSAIAVLTTALLVYFLISLAWNCWRYASVLATAGMEESKMRVRSRWLTATYVLAMLLFSLVGGIIAYKVRIQGIEILPAVIGTLANRTLWFSSPIAAIGTVSALGSIENPLYSVAGVLALGGTASLGLLYCYSHANRLSEFSHQSIAVYEKLKSRRQGTSTINNQNERARQGKVSRNAPKWVNRIRTTGEMAFVWREGLYVWRTSKAGLVGVGLIICALPWVTSQFGSLSNAFGTGIICALAGSVTAGFAQLGVQEFLKRADLIRSLPVSTRKLMRFENVARSAILMPTVALSQVVRAIFSPDQIVDIPLTLILAFVLCLQMSSITTLAMILLPDIDDPTQRQFRQLVYGLAMMFIMVLNGGLFIGTVALWHSVAAASALTSLVGLGAAWVLTTLCDAAYVRYSPTE